VKKNLTKDKFNETIKTLKIGSQTKEIAYGVLVLKKNQSEFVTRFNLSKGAVSQAVSRVWNAFLKNDIPEGYEKVTAILPHQKAFLVKKWAKNVKKKKT